MGKKSATRSLADTEARAIIRNLRISPQKLNLIAEQDPRQAGAEGS